ncbi:MAG: hypothetical protein ACXWUP_13655, partial [Allosphingosinicella sp.]
LEYEVLPALPSLKIKVDAHLETSPKRDQKLGAPLSVPTLTPDDDLEFLVAPPGDICTNITKFDTRINYERPASARGFTMSTQQQKALIETIVKPPEPLDATKIIPVPGIVRELAPVTKPTEEEAFLAHEAIVFEQSWFVEADCSASFDQLGFVVRPHQIVQVSHAGEALSGPYQVLKATHVINAAQMLTDCTLRGNGLGGRS